MNIYFCSFCNYTTKFSSNYSIHKKSKKHIQLYNNKSIDVCENYSNKLSQVIPNNIPELSLKLSLKDNLICSNCNLQFTQKSNLSRHKKRCLKKSNNNDNSKDVIINELKLQMELIKKDHTIELIKKENELYQKLEQEKSQLLKEKSELLTNFMNNANILLNKTTDNNKITTQAIQNVSMSALKYANDKFKDTPVLIPLDNFNINELSFENAEEKGQLTEILIYNAKQKSLDKLLGDHIIKYYKKENPENQSFHSTDCSRLNYIVRELIENTPTWIVDKNGIKICKDIMKPLIKKCINALLDYQKQLLYQMGNGNYNKQKDVELIIDIIMSIDSGILENDINKYIAPFFNLNKA